MSKCCFSFEYKNNIVWCSISELTNTHFTNQYSMINKFSYCLIESKKTKQNASCVQLHSARKSRFNNIFYVFPKRSNFITKVKKIFNKVYSIKTVWTVFTVSQSHFFQKNISRIYVVYNFPM